MALDPKDKQDIIDAITAGIKDSNCACGLSSDAQEEMTHFMGMAKDIGGGDRGRGVEVMRDAFKSWARWREIEAMVGKIIVRAITIALVGAALAFLGFKVVK